MTSYKSKNATLYQRRKRAVNIIKAMALEEGVMKNQTDGKGFDRFLSMMEREYIKSNTSPG